MRKYLIKMQQMKEKRLLEKSFSLDLKITDSPDLKSQTPNLRSEMLLWKQTF